MKIKRICILIIIILISIIINIENVTASTKDKNLVNIYFFHSEECSHCNSEIKLLDKLEKKYKNIKIYRYEIHTKDNSKLFREVQQLYKIKTIGVPLTIIGSTYYNGFTEEKSSIEFIKTIEYYSKYGYVDKVGELLQLDNLSIYELDENNPTLEEFKKNYGNYKLMGKLYTNDIDISLNAIILGVLSQLNITKLISILLVILILTKIKEPKNKIFLLLIYLITSLILTTTNIFNNEIYILITRILILTYFIIVLLKYNKDKKTEYLYSNILIGIIFIQNYLENYFFSNYSQIFKNLIDLYNLTGMSKIMYYINYIFAILIINILIVLLSYYLKIIMKNRLIK